ncbi:hypothetical protein [Bythopirellula polymerisocia]|uniref:Carboxypeptidase regulatory-like domain-containing protein n=1 Tax=Bythopirellula polymerisocia TaxID=2528003 RepID=A0A5C6C9F6_9BACT|nr:hypothetical protein [Bythopirellula polymerisocia]TWU20788.1 hypothetical protein Pla144_48390 [Bythopirellula polymerisocia]
MCSCNSDQPPKTQIGIWHERHRFHHKLSLALALLLGWTVVGCSDGRPQRVVVSGQVLIDDKPLAGGNIKFVPDGARPSMGTIDEEGHYKLTCFEVGDGAIPGKHRVEIVSNEILSQTAVRWCAPKKYASFLTSGLEVEISEPTDSLEIHLTWDGGKPFMEMVNMGSGKL